MLLKPNFQEMWQWLVFGKLRPENGKEMLMLDAKQRGEEIDKKTWQTFFENKS